jgi:hypothetical protein
MGSEEREPTWLRTDEKVEALEALKELNRHLEAIESEGDLNSWKWSLLSLHIALQGFMVWTIRRGHDREVISDKIYRGDQVKGITAKILLWIDSKWRRFLDRRLKRKKYSQVYQEWIEGEREWENVPNDLLCSYDELYGKIKNKIIMEDTWASGRKFQPQGTQGRSIKDLKYWRNKFIHFFPWGVSVDVALFPPILDDCIHTIEFLAFESDHIYFDSDEEERDVRSLIQEIKERLQELQTA